MARYVIGQSIDVTFLSAPAADKVTADKVKAVKSMRTLFGLSLKESVDAVSVIGRTQSFALDMPNITDDAVEHEFKKLRVLGANIGDSVHMLLNNLRELAAQALAMHEDELANEILQLVLVEKLRRSA